MTVDPPTTDVAPAAPIVPGSTKRERVGWYFYDWANSAFARPGAMRFWA